MSSRSLRILASAHPFTEPADLELPAGPTIAELIALAGMDLAAVSNARVFIVDAELRRDLMVIPRERWARVRPKPGVIVSIRITPMGGGGGGGKSPLRTILSIAVIAAAIYLGQAEFLQFGQFSLAGIAHPLFAGQILGAIGATLVGNAIVNAIAPPPNPAQSDPQAPVAINSAPATLGITGAQNQANPLGPIPAVLGTIQYYPELGAAQYTEILGSDQYLRVLFDLGYGPLSLSNQRIGEVPLDEFDGVQVEYRRGIDADYIHDKGNWDASAGAFPAGVHVFGDRYTVSVAGTVGGIDYAVGDTIIYVGVNDDISNQGWDKNADKPVTLYSNTIHEDPYQLLLTNSGGTRSLFSREGVQVDEISGDFSFQGLTAFDNTGNPGTRSINVLVEYRIAGSGGAYLTDNVELSDGTPAAAGVLTLSAASSQVVRFGFRILPAAKDQCEVRFSRQTADSASTQVRDECVITALRTIVYSPPEAPSDHCIVAMRILATNQLNGLIDQYNAVAQCMQPSWDGAAWRPPSVTRNPAWAALQVLRGKANKRPLPDNRIDLASWLAFAQRNDAHDQNGEPMFCYDNVISQVTTVRQLVNDILATARAYLTTRDGKWSVGWDGQNIGAPLLFTPRNSWDFQWERNFIDAPDALNLQFVDPDLGWKPNQVSVYDDGKDATNAQLYETQPMPGVIRKSQLVREGRYRLAEAKLRPGTYSLSVDIEGLQATRGSLCRVQHYVMKFGLGSGRIKLVYTDVDGNVIGVKLDELFTLDPAKTYGVRIRKSDGTQVAAQCIPPAVTTETDTVYFSTPIPKAVGPDVDAAADDLVTFGELNKETVDLIVKSISRLDNLHCTLQMVDAAPSLQTVDQGPIPAFDTQTTFATQRPDGAPPAPIIDQIVSDDRSLVPIPGGGWQQGIDVYLAPRSGIAVSIAQIVGKFRPVGSGLAWQKATGAPFADRIRFAPVQQGIAYELQVFAISGNPRPGVPSDPTYVASHTVIGQSAPPPDVSVVTLQNGKVDAPGYAAPVDFAGFRVSYKLGNDRLYGGAISAHPAIDHIQLPFDVSGLPAGTVTIFVTAVDTSGNESAHPAVLVKDITGPEIANIVETKDFRAIGWTGAISGGSIGAGDLAADLSVSDFWPGDEATRFWPMDDTLPLWPADDSSAAYSALSFTGEFLPDETWLPAKLTLDRDVPSGAHALCYQTDGDDPFWPVDDTELFWTGDDSDPLWADAPFQPFVGSLDLKAQAYNLRISTPGGPRQGRITQFSAVVDVDDVTESFQGLAIAPGGTALPLAKTYRYGIVDPGITLLADGGGAIGITVDLTNPKIPVVHTLDKTNADVAGHINANSRGF